MQNHEREANVFAIDELLGKLPNLTSGDAAWYKDVWDAIEEENEENAEAVLRKLSSYVIDGRPEAVIEAFDLFDVLLNGDSDDEDDNTETGNMGGDVPCTDGGNEPVA